MVVQIVVRPNGSKSSWHWEVIVQDGVRFTGDEPTKHEANTYALLRAQDVLEEET